MAALQCSLEDCSKFLKSVLPMKLHHLQDIAAHVASGNCSHPPLLKDFIFDQFPVPGTTPLLLACQHGELDSVKHIVESWGVDVRASAMFYVDPYHRSSVRLTTPPIVTPLFAAASHGHGNIVRYLLEKGANVSDKISLKNDKDSGLTPLYGAVRQYHPFSFKSLLEQQKERSAVVLSLLEFGADLIADSFRPFDGQPMWKERMCGVDAITVLIDHGLDLKQRNPATGGTLLHHWVDYPTFIYFYDHSRTHYVLEEDSLSVVKLLVEKGADLLVRDHEGFTALLKAADQFNLKVLDYLIEREEYGRMEKIEALELVGAAILFNSGNALLFPKAFEYWRRAHHLRQKEIEVSGSSSIKILGRKIGNNLEWTTLADLDQLEQHPRDYEIQALLVKLRILSSCIGVAHRDSSIGYIFYLSRSACLDNEEKFTQILDIIWGRFDVMIRRLNSLPTDSTFWTLVENDVEELVSTLSALEANHPNLLNFEKLKPSLDLILLATDQHSPININNGILNLLRMIFRLPKILKEHETISLIQSLRPLGPFRLGILLLPVCQKLVSFKALTLVRVLLEAGADPKVAVDDLHGNASLHVVAGMSDRRLGDAAAFLVMEYGANLHQVNKGGKTALDIWIERNETINNWNEEIGGWSARPEWCCPLPSLLRLAARVIRVHKLPYADGKTPTVLHSLIELRSNNNS